MTAADDNQKREAPRWLGSAARRGDTSGEGTGWADPIQDDRPRWLGSVTRRSLVLIDMDNVTSETTEPAAEEVATPPAELSERGKNLTIGELGMHLRVA